ncbi:hypothetical protein HDU76_007927 [Blyttiomyces sp. JEL0837]|nr:hypothetical protein HDU76_007927 [Blyttiomyces sp. JEL0837]
MALLSSSPFSSPVTPSPLLARSGGDHSTTLHRSLMAKPRQDAVSEAPVPVIVSQQSNKENSSPAASLDNQEPHPAVTKTVKKYVKHVASRYMQSQSHAQSQQHHSRDPTAMSANSARKNNAMAANGNHANANSVNPSNPLTRTVKRTAPSTQPLSGVQRQSAHQQLTQHHQQHQPQVHHQQTQQHQQHQASHQPSQQSYSQQHSKTLKTPGLTRPTSSSHSQSAGSNAARMGTSIAECGRGGSLRKRVPDDKGGSGGNSNTGRSPHNSSCFDDSQGSTGGVHLTGKHVEFAQDQQLRMAETEQHQQQSHESNLHSTRVPPAIPSASSSSFPQPLLGQFAEPRNHPSVEMSHQIQQQHQRPPLHVAPMGAKTAAQHIPPAKVDSIADTTRKAPNTAREVSLEDQVMMLKGRLIQWLFVCARASHAFTIQKKSVEAQIYRAWCVLSTKKEELHSLERENKTRQYLERQLNELMQEEQTLIRLRAAQSKLDRYYGSLAGLVKLALWTVKLNGVAVQDADRFAESVGDVARQLASFFTTTQDLLVNIEKLGQLSTSSVETLASGNRELVECIKLSRTISALELSHRSLEAEKVQVSRGSLLESL